MKKLYIFGIQRSGTTLLSFLLGAHSDINMLVHSTSGDQTKLAGKMYQGNKLCVYHDIRWNTKSSRLRNLLFYKTMKYFLKIKKYHALRPSARFTVKELLREDCKVVVITRNANTNILSMLRRTNMTRKKAVKEYIKGADIIKKIKQHSNCYVVEFINLTSNTKEELIKICAYLEIPFEEKMLDGFKFQELYNNKTIEPKQ